MPILGFSQQIFDDTRLATRISQDTLAQFCQFAVDTLQKGAPSQKVFAKVADSLKVELDELVKCIHALSDILVECAKRGVNEADFATSIADLQFSAEASALFVELYAANSATIREYLSDLSLKLPHYHNLDWRLDIQIGTRSIRNAVQPSFLLELDTRGSAGGPNLTVMQSDLANLQNVANQLEQALKECRSKHCNRILRYVR